MYPQNSAREVAGQASAQAVGSLAINSQKQSESRFGHIASRLSDALDRARDTAQRLERLADNLGGPVPQDPQKAGIDRPPAGHFAAHVEDHLTGIEAAFGRIYNAVNRLESL